MSDTPQPIFTVQAPVGRDARALAETAMRKVLEVAPGDPNARTGLALILLARGEYEEGWALYESRYDLPGAPVRKPNLAFPEWTGQPVGSLLIFPEQGLGDQIMLARYIPVLQARGVQVSLLCAPPLARLFDHLPATVIPAAGSVSIPRHEAWCMLGSLPRLVGGLPAEPYLPGAGPGRGVGVCVSGNPKHVNDANRSLDPASAARLRALPGAVDLDPARSGAKDFQDTADIVAGLDLVISVDTAVAHLAGAMGKPVRILLPATATDWRWMRERTDSPWYPSARLYRQPAHGDWAGALDAVAADLAARQP